MPTLPWKPRFTSFVLSSFVFSVWLLHNVMAGNLYTPDEVLTTSGRITYTLYLTKLPWNRAQEACRRTHNGHLAIIDTITVRNIIMELTQSSGDWESDWSHVWVGLHWPSSTKKQWADRVCQPFEDHGAPFKDDVERNYKSDSRCYILDAGSVSFERKPCKDDFQFICQHFEQEPSGWTYAQINLAFTTVNNDATTTCNQTCNDVSGCLLNSKVDATTCILGIADLDAETYSKILTHTTSSGGHTLSAAVQNAVDNAIPEIENPAQCTPDSLLPPFVGNLVDASNIVAAPAVQCYNYTTTETETVTNTLEVTNILSFPCSSDTVTVTTVNLATSVVYVTTTAIEISSYPVILTTVRDVTVTTTDVTTTPVYVTETVMTSQFCSTPSISSCPSCSCSVSPSQSTSYAGLSSLCSSVGASSETYGVSTDTSDGSIASSFTNSVATSIASSFTNSVATSIASSFPNSVTSSFTSSVASSISSSLTNSIASSGLSPVSVWPMDIDLLTMNIVKHLKIDSRSTAKALARLNSATDPRKSSQTIGILAVTFITLVAVLIFLADIPTFFQICRMHSDNLRKLVGGGGGGGGSV